MKTATLIASVLVIVLAPAAVQSQVEQSLIRIDYTRTMYDAEGNALWTASGTYKFDDSGLVHRHDFTAPSGELVSVICSYDRADRVPARCAPGGAAVRRKSRFRRKRSTPTEK